MGTRDYFPLSLRNQQSILPAIPGRLKVATLQ